MRSKATFPQLTSHSQKVEEPRFTPGSSKNPYSWPTLDISMPCFLISHSQNCIHQCSFLPAQFIAFYFQDVFGIRVSQGLQRHKWPIQKQTKPSGMVKETSKGWWSSQVLTHWDAVTTPSLERARGVNNAMGVQRKLGLWKWDHVPVRHGDEENKYPNSLSSWLLISYLCFTASYLDHCGCLLNDLTSFPSTLSCCPITRPDSLRCHILSVSFLLTTFKGLSLLLILLSMVLQILSLIPLSNVLFCNSPSPSLQLASSFLSPFL